MGVSASTHDRGHFLRLFLAAERDILRYLSAILPQPQDARDVLQETALTLWEEFHRYDTARPFLPWAIRFALNKARQHTSRHARRPHLLADEPLLEKILAEQVAQRGRFETRHDRLSECVERLPPHHAALVRSYYWDGREIEQLAAEARGTVDAIYKRLQRIRAILLDCVRKLEAEPRAV
jgi:RNA polymerase sigma-70 factor (ECF subfamily)